MNNYSRSSLSRGGYNRLDTRNDGDDDSTKEKLKRIGTTAALAFGGTAVGYTAGAVLGKKLLDSNKVQLKIKRMTPVERRRLLDIIRAGSSAMGATAAFSSNMFFNKGDHKI